MQVVSVVLYILSQMKFNVSGSKKQVSDSVSPEML